MKQNTSSRQQSSKLHKNSALQNASAKQTTSAKQPSTTNEKIYITDRFGNRALSFKTASGNIPYNMTNDYMFRAVLQSNKKVLTGLICSLLHLNINDISSIEIANSVILGQAVDDKEIRLDINVLLNDSVYINLEMQVANELNWHNRSVIYLGRSVDILNKGQKYNELKAAVHIGFLDYTLFPECSEFYATYKLINVKNFNIFSDNITLSVVDLTKINLATEEDRMFGIDKWAALFKAKTWEELRMIAGNDEYLISACNSIFEHATEADIIKMCREREEYYLDQIAFREEIKRRDVTIAEKDETIAEKDETIAQQNDLIRQLLAENKRLKNIQ